jgi:DNA-binding response OmpR family regulator
LLKGWSFTRESDAAGRKKRMDRTILLVDEPTRTRELLASILRKLGYAVFESDDGEDALRRILRVRPDLVIIEAMLPFLSGFEVCAILRRDPALRSLPILMMCSLTHHLVRDDGHWRDHVPADEFLNRPFGLNDLLGRVEKLLGAVPNPQPLSR